MPVIQARNPLAKSGRQAVNAQSNARRCSQLDITGNLLEASQTCLTGTDGSVALRPARSKRIHSRHSRFVIRTTESRGTGCNSLNLEVISRPASVVHPRFVCLCVP